MQHVIKSLDESTTDWRLDIDLQQRCIHVDAIDPDGKIYSITIEVVDDKLVLQCSDPIHDEPLRVRLSAIGTIETDDERGGDQIIHHPQWTGPAAC